jgi:hypothetical protein
VENPESAFLLVLGRLFAEDVIEKRHRDHEHHQCKADREETNESEELSSQENLEGDFEVVFEHNSVFSF